MYMFAWINSCTYAAKGFAGSSSSATGNTKSTDASRAKALRKGQANGQQLLALRGNAFMTKTWISVIFRNPTRCLFQFSPNDIFIPDYTNSVRQDASVRQRDAIVQREAAIIAEHRPAPAWRCC